MPALLYRSLLVAALGLGIAPAAFAKPAAAPEPARIYQRMVAKVANMVDDERAYRVAQSQGLQLLNVLWEDTGRWEGSAVGPNISDVTIEVEGFNNGKRSRTYLMPVMRHDNFTDKTADLRSDEIMIPVGNHREGGELEVISLAELLEHPGDYLSAPELGKIKGDTLLAKRDTHVLVSAQHAFLPVPEGGQAKFWPVIFNYQSSKRNPAVLTILVTRQGTSITIVDNAHDVVGADGSWGQRLYFNAAGNKAPLVAERLADVKASGVTTNGDAAADLGDDSNVLMLIQVPLKYRQPRAPKMASGPSALESADALAAPSAGGTGAGSGYGAERSNVDTAVLGHGPTEGEFDELAGLTIARDARFPVRVTLQFYQATSNGVISRADGKAMAAQIKKVYRQGDFVGSLVVPTAADRARPTNWTDVSPAPESIAWREFPGLVEHVTFGLRARAGIF